MGVPQGWGGVGRASPTLLPFSAPYTRPALRMSSQGKREIGVHGCGGGEGGRGREGGGKREMSLSPPCRKTPKPRRKACWLPPPTPLRSWALHPLRLTILSLCCSRRLSCAQPGWLWAAQGCGTDLGGKWALNLVWNILARMTSSSASSTLVAVNATIFHVVRRVSWVLGHVCSAGRENTAAVRLPGCAGAGVPTH